MRAAALTATLIVLMATPAAAQQRGDEEGARIFDMVCAMCHSMTPPAKAAPPMSHAAAYYIRKHDTMPASVAALVAYLKEPVAERSAMPAHAIERFGLMPPQAHLSDAQLQAVARYVLALADTAHVSAGHSHR
jgi:cytochrome c